MTLPRTVIKSTGEEEEFSPGKLERSLRVAGAEKALAGEVRKTLEKVGHDIVSTDQIHRYVYEYLKNEASPVAARYNLRRAIIQLGPSGYPFEKFVGEILRELGYKVMLNQYIHGACISHEVDFVAIEGSNETKSSPSFMGEVKFHTRTGVKTDSKVSLYVNSRFRDLVENQQQLSLNYGQLKQAWIITNTKFSKDAIRYAACQRMKLTAWAYPRGESLGEIIDRLGVHPVTALTKLTPQHKEYLVEQGIVLCKQLRENVKVLEQLGMNDHMIGSVVGEAEAVCAFNN